MAEFSRLGSILGDDLAGMVLNEDVVAFGELGGLGWSCEGGVCGGGGEVVVLT